MTRRFLLKSVLMSFLGVLFLRKKSLPLYTPELTDETILQGLLDALIPSDDMPGSMEAHLYKKLNALISEDTKRQKIYRAGLFMVQQEIEKTIGEQTDWDAILRKIAPSRFFRVLRWDALRLFYADPAGWKTVGYKGPPLVGYGTYDKC